MPRTKVKRSAVAQKTQGNENVTALLVVMEQKKQMGLNLIDQEMKTLIESIVNKDYEERLSIPNKYMNMKISELNKLESFSNTTIKESRLNTVQIKSRKKMKTRSSSCSNDDEGYLTTDSGTGLRASKARASRSKVKKTQNTRLTRSLSRIDKTPSNKLIMPDSYGLITPKVKPNTPLVLVRRPRIGEMVLSVKGSPVLAAPNLESMANINIPLIDGTLLSLQAQAGLRKSQIPDLDPEVKRQLQMLRQHLDIMVPEQE